MAKKNLLFGVLVLALVFGMTVVGCDNGTTDDADTSWSMVTSMFQLNGTWKGSISYPDAHPSLDITSTTIVEMTINFVAANTTTGTATGTGKMTMSFSGSDVIPDWSDIKEELEHEGFTVNEAAHSGTRTDTIGPIVMTLSTMGVVMINQNGTKIIMHIGDFDFILNKQ